MNIDRRDICYNKEVDKIGKFELFNGSKNIYVKYDHLYGTSLIPLFEKDCYFIFEVNGQNIWSI